MVNISLHLRGEQLQYFSFQNNEIGNVHLVSSENILSFHLNFKRLFLGIVSLPAHSYLIHHCWEFPDKTGIFETPPGGRI